MVTSYQPYTDSEGRGAHQETTLSSALEALPFVQVLEDLHRVNDREGLVGWARTGLSRMMDFTSMACLMADLDGAGSRIRDVITTPDVSACFDGIGTNGVDVGPFGAAIADCGRGDGLDGASTALMDFWLLDRCAVRVTAGSAHCATGNRALRPLLDCLDADAIVAHGVHEAFSGSTTFVMLGAAPGPDEMADTLGVLELIMPSLHVARQRIYRNERAGDAVAKALSLTEREVRILELIAQGKTDAEVAAVIGRSVHTIKNQVRHLLHKLKVRSRTQAVLQASQQGLVQFE